MEDILDIIIPILGFAFYTFIKLRKIPLKENRESTQGVNRPAIPKQNIEYKRDVTKQKVNQPSIDIIEYEKEKLETNDIQRALVEENKDYSIIPVKEIETTNDSIEKELNDDEVVRFTSDSILNGMIMSEVLGRPVSKR